MARPRTKVTKDELEAEVINIVWGEVRAWEDPHYFINEKVAFRMKELIRHFRKNYWGVFDNPVDPAGRKKLWRHLTKRAVHDTYKSIDLDTKDINFRSKRRDGVPVTDIIRGKAREMLESHTFDGMTFGEMLDELEIQLGIDGTVVWKTTPVTHKGKVMPSITNPDLLNIYIDPSARSIQSAFRFTERALMMPDEIKGMDWDNTSEVTYSTDLHPIDSNLTPSSNEGTTQAIDVYELWGLVPEYFFTLNRKDTDLVEGHLVVSGLQKGKKLVHLIERNTIKDKDGNTVKPYEECRLFKVAGLWYGQGVSWLIMWEQEYANLIRNLRINKNTLSQLGLFKIRTGANVTQDQLNGLLSSGVIKVNQMDDIDNFVVPPVDVSSYRDDELVDNEVRSLTSTYLGTTGEPTPASMPATNAVLQNQNAQSLFTVFKEVMGMFLTRWCDRHFLPIVAKNLKKGADVRIFGDVENINKLRRRVVSFLAMQELDNVYAQGVIPTQQEFDMAMQMAEAKLKEDGDLFFEVLEDIAVNGIDTQVDITNELLDKNVTVANLKDVLAQAPEYRKEILAQMFDLMGLELPVKSEEASQMAPGAAPEQSSPITAQQIMTQAAVPQPNG